MLYLFLLYIVEVESPLLKLAEVVLHVDVNRLAVGGERGVIQSEFLLG